MTDQMTAPEVDVTGLIGTFFPDRVPGMHIAGEWLTGSARLATVDPSTGTPVAEVPVASPEDVCAAIDAAEAAQPAWAALDLDERITCLHRLADALERLGPELALLESVDSGNPLRATRRDVSLCLRYLRQWPAHALTLSGRATTPYADGLSYTLRRPYGVVGRIVAYNHPALFAVGGMIFPLLAGNTVVIKAADQTPLGTLALGRIVAEALPDGVVNLVSGDGRTGDALVTDPRTKRISFVGSDATATIIQSRLSVSGTVKHFTAELGGKNAMIVCPDVDLPASVDAAVAGLSLRISQGQSCQATSRLLVHRSVHDEFVEGMATALSQMTIGAAYDEEMDMGPLVTARHRERVEGFIADATREGAEIATGGRRPAGAPDGGFYLEPTVVVGASQDSRIVREEVFGPVVTVQAWDRERDALDMANDSHLGLSAAVWSRDIDRALRLAHGIEAGYVWVNDANRHYPGAPFGGVKGSGVGREECVEDLLSYSELKAVNVRIEQRPGEES